MDPKCIHDLLFSKTDEITGAKTFKVPAKLEKAGIHLLPQEQIFSII